MGLKRTEDLPIRILRNPTAIPVPGNPLLIERIRLRDYPDLTEELVEFFESQKLPWSWKQSSEDRFKPLLETLSPLRGENRGRLAMRPRLRPQVVGICLFGVWAIGTVYLFFRNSSGHNGPFR